MAITTLEEKMVHELGDIYDAEHQFLELMQEALPKANSDTVKMLLQQHIAETEQQISTLKQVFEALGKKAKRVSCQGASGIVAENQKTLKQVSKNPALADLAIAGGSSKVEHYEIACYRSLITGAQQMGQNHIAQLLQQNLQQEEQTAQKIEQSAPMLFQKAMAQAASA